jgi:Ca2+-binding RTX toxin-like protein
LTMNLSPTCLTAGELPDRPIERICIIFKKTGSVSTIMQNESTFAIKIVSNKARIKNPTITNMLVIFAATATMLALTPITSAFAVTLSGTNGDDMLRGTNNSDTIDGKRGDDAIYGYGGKDTLYGGTGDDRIKGGSGDDYIYGWYGGNTLSGGTGNDHIYTTGPSDPRSSFPLNVIHGNAGGDYIKVAVQNAKIYGDKGADTIIAVGGDEEVVHQTVYAGSGNDVVETEYTAYGEGGNDHLKGEVNAELHGGEGDDTLEANNADHVYLTGDSGADHFDCGGYSQEDVTIKDFNAAEGDTKTADCENGLEESVSTLDNNNDNNANTTETDTTPTSTPTSGVAEDSPATEEEDASSLPGTTTAASSSNNSTETTEATGTAKIQKTMEVLPDEEPPADGEAEPPTNDTGGQ